MNSQEKPQIPFLFPDGGELLWQHVVCLNLCVFPSASFWFLFASPFVHTHSHNYCISVTTPYSPRSQNSLFVFTHVPVDPADCVSFCGFSETGFCTLIGIQVHMSCLPVYLPVLTVCLPTCQLVCLSFSLFPTFPQSKITKRC